MKKIINKLQDASQKMNDEHFMDIIETALEFENNELI